MTRLTIVARYEGSEAGVYKLWPDNKSDPGVPIMALASYFQKAYRNL